MEYLYQFLYKQFFQFRRRNIKKRSKEIQTNVDLATLKSLEKMKTLKIITKLVNSSEVTKISRLRMMFYLFQQGQKICPEEEWDAMVKALRTDLPTGFRITSHPKYEAEALLSLVESVYFKDLITSKDDNEVVKKPFCLPW